MTDNDFKGKDKWMHFGACLAASLFSTLFAIGLALGKECGDKRAQGNHWCWWDIAYDALGIMLGTVIRCTICYALTLPSLTYIL